MGSIIVSGEKFEVPANVICWNDPDGKSFYPYPSSFASREKSLQELQSEINGVVLHHSQTFRAVNTFNVLVARGLSVNFIVDDNEIDGYATIFQCLDVKDAGYSHKPLNLFCVGVEVSYMAFRDKQSYTKGEHEETVEFIRGAKLKGYAPTYAQVRAVAAICIGLKKAFPEMEMKFPRDAEGGVSRNVEKNPKGLLCHYHVSNQKIDPLGLNHEELEDLIEGKDIYD